MTGPALEVYVGMATTTPSGPQPGPVTGLTPFTFDLTAHEIRRITAVLDAMPDWDPAAVLAAEVEAYSGLDLQWNRNAR